MSELKNCPFCGSVAMIAYSSGNEHTNQSWTVACTRCVCRGATFYGANSWESISKAKERTDKQAEQKAVDWWSRRAPAIPADLRGDLTRLCEYLEMKGLMTVSPRIITKQIREMLGEV